VIKSKELKDPKSCLNKAKKGEWLFVLLGRDYATPATIRFWIGERLRLGLNKPGDAQLDEAEEAAASIEAEQPEVKF